MPASPCPRRQEKHRDQQSYRDDLQDRYAVQQPDEDPGHAPSDRRNQPDRERSGIAVFVLRAGICKLSHPARVVLAPPGALERSWQSADGAAVAMSGAVLTGRHAGQTLEPSSEMRLISEARCVRHLENRITGRQSALGDTQATL